MDDVDTSETSASILTAAERLRKQREMLGLSQAEVARRIGVNEPRYRQWERVFGSLPQRQYREALARVLAVPPDWLCAGVGDAPVHNTLVDYEALAQRAATRRRSLKLSRSNVARSIGVNAVTLAAWEQCLPKVARDAQEGRWETAIGVPYGWLRNPNAQVPDISRGHTLDLSSAAPETVSEEIQLVGNWLSRASIRVRSVSREGQSHSERCKAAMFAERYGVAGAQRATLQAIGNQFNLTRERVRQIIDVMMTRSQDAKFVLPRLLQLKELVQTATAASIADFESTHRNLLGSHLSFTDADRFARELVGVGLGSVTVRSHWQAGNGLQPMLAGTAGAHLAVAIRDCSRRMIRSCGAANLMYVTGMVSAKTNGSVSVSDVRATLAAVEGMEWLTEEHDWYWFGTETANNRALDVARKALSVAGRRLDIEDLHQAVCRSRRLMYEDRAHPPAVEAPKHVLRELFSRVPWMRVVQFDDFALLDEASVSETLNSSELAVFECIRRHGGAVARQVLNKELVASRLFSAPNLQAVLSNSPVVRPLGFGIYGLRGVPFTEQAFTTAIGLLGTSSSAGASPQCMAETDSAGWHSFILNVTASRLKNGVVDFPTAVVRALSPGEYDAEGLSQGNFNIGQVPSAPGRVTRFVSLLRKAGVKEGERLVLRIHGATRRVHISRAAASA